MPGTVPQESELEILNNELSGWLAGCYMALYATDVALGTGTTLASLLAAECTFAGYSRALLNVWSTPVIDGTGAAVSTTTKGQFIPSGAAGSGNIFGYFLVNNLSSQFYGVERFSGAPITVAQLVTLEVDCTYSTITRY